MIRYKTRTHVKHLSVVEIEEVEILRETESSVFILRGGRERRERARTDWAIYHKTREDAIAYLKFVSEQYRAACEHHLATAQQIIAKVGQLESK